MQLRELRERNRLGDQIALLDVEPARGEPGERLPAGAALRILINANRHGVRLGSTAVGSGNHRSRLGRFCLRSGANAERAEPRGTSATRGCRKPGIRDPHEWPRLARRPRGKTMNARGSLAALRAAVLSAG